MSNSLIPLTLLTGFLGAGKTTLLNQILHAEHGLKVAVLVNDFGAVNIDTQLVVGVEGETISLANGCICCTIRDDLLQATLQLVTREDKPEYIIVETSGVSDPEAVAVTFLLPEVRQHIALDSIITVVDSEQVRDLSGADAVLAMDQVGTADIVILNKVDLVTATQLEQVRGWVRGLTPRTRILEATHANVPLELLLGVGAFTPETLHQRERRDIHVHAQEALKLNDDEAEHESEHTLEHHHHHPEHTNHTLVFDTWSFTSTEPFSFRILRDVVRQLPTTIFRAKGVLYFADSPNRRGLLQVVGKRVRMTMGEPWGEAEPRTQMVVIGSAGGVNAAELQKSFESCLEKNANQPEPTSLNQALEWVRATFGVGQQVNS